MKSMIINIIIIIIINIIIIICMPSPITWTGVELSGLKPTKEIWFWILDKSVFDPEIEQTGKYCRVHCYSVCLPFAVFFTDGLHEI
jgi:hypothetical protein